MVKTLKKELMMNKNFAGGNGKQRSAPVTKDVGGNGKPRAPATKDAGGKGKSR